MVWVPTTREDVASDVADPPLSVLAAPICGPGAAHVPPSKNDTLPVGVPAPGATALTVAVNVNDCPKTEGFVPLASVATVEVFALLTVCVTAAEVLVLKLV